MAKARKPKAATMKMMKPLRTRPSMPRIKKMRQ